MKHYTQLIDDERYTIATLRANRMNNPKIARTGENRRKPRKPETAFNIFTGSSDFIADSFYLVTPGRTVLFAV